MDTNDQNDAQLIIDDPIDDTALEDAALNDAELGISRAVRRRPWFTAAMMLLAVLAGGAIGSGLTIIAFRYTVFPFPRQPHPDKMATVFLERMESLFELTDDETRQVRDTIERQMKEVKRIREASFGEIRTHLDSMRQELATVLGPERSATWENFLRDQRRQSPGPWSPGSGFGSGGPRHGMPNGARQRGTPPEGMPQLPPPQSIP